MKIEHAKTRSVSPELTSRGNNSPRLSLFQELSKDEIVYVDLENLIPFKHQARYEFDESEIESLAETIKEYGIRQPLTVLLRENDNFEIVSGERRYRAAKIAGLHNVPCIVLKDKSMAQAIALVENVQRTDLTPIELGAGLAGLLERRVFMRKGDMARTLGIPRSKVSECLALLELNKDVIEKIKEHKIVNRDVLRKLCSFPSTKEQLYYIEEISKSSDEESVQKAPVLKNIRSGVLSSSVIRISLSENEFKLQKKKLSKLTSNHRSELRDILEKLLLEL